MNQQYESNIENTLNVIKPVTEKFKVGNDNFPKSLYINQEKITDKKYYS